MGTLRSSVVALAVLVGAFVATVPAAADEGNGPGAYRPYYPGIWQGLYGGVNVGWGGSGDASGVGGGGQIGYNWQSNQYICGLEGDISAADIGISETIVVPGAVLNASASIDWIATIRGRVGVLVQPRLLIYGTAGLAIVNAEAHGSVNAFGFRQLSARESTTETGLVFAVGVEEQAHRDNVRAPGIIGV